MLTAKLQNLFNAQNIFNNFFIGFTRFFHLKMLVFPEKSIIFAHNDAEAPSSVFLFNHIKYFYRRIQ